MRFKRVSLVLEPEDAREVLAIDLDQDPQRALAFVRERLLKPVKNALQPH